jgi:hypothetical protein
MLIRLIAKTSVKNVGASQRGFSVLLMDPGGLPSVSLKLVPVCFCSNASVGLHLSPVAFTDMSHGWRRFAILHTL